MATTQHEIYERARLARDPRFDGRFYIGVKTTGIYCRPICPANLPRSENIDFYPTAAAAAEAGFRPCLRCRPETAPGTPAWSGTSTTVQRGLRLIANGALDDGGIEDLSDRLGVSSRHLRRLFRQHLGASPQMVAHTQRLHFAKQLLDDSDLPLHQVAVVAGYGSVRRFNDAFRNSYGRTPRDLRKVRKRPHTGGTAAVSVTLPYRQPFDWPGMLRYLSARAIPGVESIDSGRYLRSVVLNGNAGVLEISDHPKRGALRLNLHGITIADLFPVVQRVKTLFDLDAPVSEIAAVLQLDNFLAECLKQLPGVRVPGCWNGFELAVRTILGQQVSVAGATTVTGRVAESFGTPLDAGRFIEGTSLNRLFPEPEVLVDARLEEIGVIRSRANAIRDLSLAVCNGDLAFDDSQEPETFVSRLTSIKGIGDWTAQYLSMRVLRNPDAFPASDLGLQKAMDPQRRMTSGELKSKAEDWRPWRAYAAMLLWQGPQSSGG